jgi:hypothetical protein
MSFMSMGVDKTKKRLYSYYKGIQKANTLNKGEIRENLPKLAATLDGNYKTVPCAGFQLFHNDDASCSSTPRTAPYFLGGDL